jgi:lysophospholipase L1-like esterase
MKIAFFGNSLVAGSYGGNFVDEVASRLPLHTILNAGQNGNTVFNLLQRLDALLDEQPDEVVILCGGNDAISYSQPDTRRYYERVMNVPGGVVTPEQFATAFRDLLTRIQLAQVVIRVILPPIEYNPATLAAAHHYNRLMTEACTASNLPTLDLMSVLAPTTVPGRPSLNQTTINLIGQRLASGWNDYEDERWRGGFTYSFDGIHFTPETARRVAEWVVDFLDLK